MRKKYAKFEGSLRGIDARILTAQVPGGMLTNMENQLREQDATDRFDEVLAEMPAVREELGFIPLVTPTSQIVGTQSIVNVLAGERYETITRETAGVLRGEYGRTPAPVDADLQKRALKGDDPVTCRPADLLSPEMGKLTADVNGLAKEQGFRRAGDPVEDVLTYALFGQVGLKFLKNRNDPSAFEPPPWEDAAAPPPAAPTAAPAAGTGPARYRGQRQRDGLRTSKSVPRAPSIRSSPPGRPRGPPPPPRRPLPGSRSLRRFRARCAPVRVQPGQAVAVGDVVLVLEAMKMETNVSAPRAGRVVSIAVRKAPRSGRATPCSTSPSRPG